MLRLLERDPHGQRLRDLLARFRTQELALALHLQHLQALLEEAHRAASGAAVADGTAPAGSLRTRCLELQLACDQLATELVHVRMAVTGVCEELAEHDRARFEAENEQLSPTA